HVFSDHYYLRDFRYERARHDPDLADPALHDGLGTAQGAHAGTSGDAGQGLFDGNDAQRGIDCRTRDRITILTASTRNRSAPAYVRVTTTPASWGVASLSG